MARRDPRPARPRPQRFDPRGTTALVTGASSGIGEEFARRLAARGADLVLIARRAPRLESLAAELADSFGVSSTVLAIDLSVTDATARIVAELSARGIHPSTLVNNAAFGSHGAFAEVDAHRIDREVQVNVAAVVGLTRALLPGLIADGRGALVNVASTAAFQPIPQMAVYAASKAFVLSFTEAIAWETRHSLLRVIALNPGPTDTEFSSVADSSDASFGPKQTVAQVVDTAMRALDRRRTPASVISGTRNFIQTLGLRIAPRAVVLRVVGRGGER